MNKNRILDLGKCVKLKPYVQSSHPHIHWDKGMILEFSADNQECKIISVVDDKQKIFTEFVKDIMLDED